MDIKDISRQEHRLQVAKHFEALQQAKEMHRNSDVNDRFDYLERKLDGLYLILEQMIQQHPPIDILNYYPKGSYYDELTRQTSE
jgi:hypothetical protein